MWSDSFPENPFESFKMNQENQYKNKTCVVCFKPDGTPSACNRILGLCDKCQELIDKDIELQTEEAINGHEIHIDKEKAATGETSRKQYDEYFRGMNDEETSIETEWFFNGHATTEEVGFAFMIWLHRTWCVSIHFLFWHLSFGRMYALKTRKTGKNDECAGCGSPLDENGSCPLCIAFEHEKGRV